MHIVEFTEIISDLPNVTHIYFYFSVVSIFVVLGAKSKKNIPDIKAVMCHSLLFFC